MISDVRRVISKIQRSGFKAALKSSGQVLHFNLFPTRWDFQLIPSLLTRILHEKGSLTVVQVGANIGDTESDQLFKFFNQRGPGGNASTDNVRAVLIEPVRHLYQQLARNYSGFSGITCRNVAIAEKSGTKTFFRLREGIDLAAHGLPAYAEQLGSFARENLASLWAQDPQNQKLKDFALANIIEEQVSCLTLEQVLEEERIADIDLLQIDTEGYDYEILRTIDFRKIMPRYINYERIHLGKDEARCRRLLLSKGYGLHDHGQDTFCSAHQTLGWVQRWKHCVYNKWLETIF